MSKKTRWGLISLGLGGAWAALTTVLILTYHSHPSQRWNVGLFWAILFACAAVAATFGMIE